MPRTIRFHLDEHCDPAIAEGLRRHGIDVTTTREAGLIGTTDEEQVAYALPLGRVLFTQDSDYVKLHAAGAPHAGITYCHQQTRSVGEIINALVLIWEVYLPEEMAGRVEYL
jgi:predicted nuclease of predicted toxin-antitoxin system